MSAAQRQALRTAPRPRCIPAPLRYISTWKIIPQARFIETRRAHRPVARHDWLDTRSADAWGAAIGGEAKPGQRRRLIVTGNESVRDYRLRDAQSRRFASRQGGVGGGKAKAHRARLGCAPLVLSRKPLRLSVLIRVAIDMANYAGVEGLQQRSLGGEGLVLDYIMASKGNGMQQDACHRYPAYASP